MHFPSFLLGLIAVSAACVGAMPTPPDSGLALAIRAGPTGSRIATRGSDDEEEKSDTVTPPSTLSPAESQELMKELEAFTKVVMSSPASFDERMAVLTAAKMELHINVNNGPPNSEVLDKAMAQRTKGLLQQSEPTKPNTASQ